MNRSTLFLSGIFVSRLGDSFSFLAFILVMTSHGVPASGVSAFMVSRYLPGALIGLLREDWFDGIALKKSLVIAYLASAALMLTACLVTTSPFLLIMVSTLLGVSYGFYVPLQRAYLAEVFPANELKSASALMQTADVSAKTIGFMLAGFAFNELGPVVSFFLDAFSFLTIAALVALTKPIRPHPPSSRSLSSPASRTHPELVAITSVFSLTWLSTGALFALEAGYAKEYLGASDATVGWLFASATLGSLAAPFISSRFTIEKNSQLLPLICFGELVMVGAYARAETLILAFSCIIGYGLFLSLRQIYIVAWIHSFIPEVSRRGAFAFQQGHTNVAMMLGMGLSGPLAQVFNIPAVILGFVLLSSLGIMASQATRIFHEPHDGG